MKRWMTAARAFFSKNEETPSEWPSVVLLLSEPFVVSDEELLKTAKEVWPLSVELHRLREFVLLSLENKPINVIRASARYEVGATEPSAERQRVWDRHQAWVAFDIQRLHDVPREDWYGAYRLTMPLAMKFWDDKVCGLYFPAEGVTIPNLGEWHESMQWAKQNGSNFSFLFPPKK